MDNPRANSANHTPGSGPEDRALPPARQAPALMEGQSQVQSAGPGSAEVRRRHVFYIPGYDPIHPRRYRELYRSEGAEQARLSGYGLSLSPGKSGARYGWSVTGEIEGARTLAGFEVLIWADLVRSSMKASIAGTYWLLARTAWAYIGSGTLRRLMWLRKGPVIAALYPVVMLLGQALLALLLAALAGRLVLGGLNAGLGLAGLVVGPGAQGAAGIWTGRLIWWPVFLVTAALILRWFRKQDGRFFAWYLMHDYAFSARWNGANPPALEERMAVFRARIAAALREPGGEGPVDEVLVVGHSSGAHLAVSVLADLIRAGEVPQQGPKLSFLSLGQVIPMVSFLPGATRLRRDLNYLSARTELFWLDISAPGDGCSFALCDPAGVSGVAPEGQTGPLILSAAFSRTLSPARWKQLRWRFFRLHFQYLCAFDNLPGRADDYEYFRTTAGPLTLAGRYGARAPSASRIDVPASKYTAMAPAPPEVAPPEMAPVEIAAPEIGSSRDGSA